MALQPVQDIKFLKFNEGISGPYGISGASGISGNIGAMGPAGISGITGATGISGASGPTGPSSGLRYIGTYTITVSTTNQRFVDTGIVLPDLTTTSTRLYLINSFIPHHSFICIPAKDLAATSTKANNDISADGLLYEAEASETNVDVRVARSTTSTLLIAVSVPSTPNPAVSYNMYIFT